MLGLLLLMILVVGMLAWKSRGSLSPEMGQIELEAQRIANEANRQSLQAKQQATEALKISEQNSSLIEDAGFIEAIRVALLADPAFNKGTTRIAQTAYDALEEKRAILPRPHDESRK